MTKIEWTDKSWNPFRARNLETGGIGHFCVHESPGCKNCYAETMQKRFGNPVRFAAQDAGKVETFIDKKTLLEPYSWRKPRQVFVCSMTDLFYEGHTDGQIMQVLGVIFDNPQHIFQVLTKRTIRMYTFMRRWGDLSGEDFEPKLVQGPDETRAAHPSPRGQLFADMLEAMGDKPEGAAYPMFDWMEGAIHWPNFPANLWLGVSCEDQHRADDRIPDLLRTPAAKRFISAEPLLGHIDLTGLPTMAGDIFLNGLTGQRTMMFRSGKHLDFSDIGPAIDQVIVGGESGHKARPMHPEWARDLRDQCAKSGVAFFMKQMTKKAPIPEDLMVREWPGDAVADSRQRSNG